MADGSPSVLLLIPAYNEEERIGPVLRDYATYFREYYEGKFRAVVVLNGCRDNTLGLVEEVAKEFPEIEPLNFEAPIGKGGALIELDGRKPWPVNHGPTTPETLLADACTLIQSRFFSRDQGGRFAMTVLASKQ